MPWLFLEVSLCTVSFSPYRGKKHRHGKGMRSRNCRLNMGIVCFVGFAVAIVYKQM